MPFVGVLQRRSALRHAAFERGVKLVQQLLSALALADVQDDAQHPLRLALRVILEYATAGYPMDAPVGPHHPVFGLIGDVLGHAAAQLRLNARQVLRMDALSPVEVSVF